MRLGNKQINRSSSRPIRFNYLGFNRFVPSKIRPMWLSTLLGVHNDMSGLVRTAPPVPAQTGLARTSPVPARYPPQPPTGMASW